MMYNSQYNFFLHSIYSLKQNKCLIKNGRLVKCLIPSRPDKEAESFSHCGAGNSPLSRSSIRSHKRSYLRSMIEGQ